MARFVIPANDIDTSGVAVDAAIPVDWLESELADAEVGAPHPGHLAARLSRSGGDEIVVRGRVRAGVTVPCARCLQPAPIEVDGELSLLLKPAPGERRVGAAGQAREAGADEGGRRRHGDGARAGNGRARGAGGGASDRDAAGSRGKRKDIEYEFSADEADVDTYDGEQVVLDPFVREAILLELPNFPLCSEACPGIAPGASSSPAEPAAGALSVDPRLAPLGALRARLGATAGEAPPATLPRAAKRKAKLPVSLTKAPKKKPRKKKE